MNPAIEVPVDTPAEPVLLDHLLTLENSERRGFQDTPGHGDPLVSTGPLVL